MNKFFYYNSLCTGSNTPSVFSIDPYVTAIKELLVSELKQTVYYIEKLRRLDFNMQLYTDKVIEFTAALIINLDFTKEDAFIIIEDLYNNKKMLERMYISACGKNGAQPEMPLEQDSCLSSKENILKALNAKEKDIKTKIPEKKISKNRKYLYEIMLNIVLNACNNLIELKSYGIDAAEYKNKVLEFLNTSNMPSLSDDELKISIKDFSKSSYETAKTLYTALTDKFGPVLETEAEICTKKGKAVLVSGSCYYELEQILKAVKGLNIYVYSYHEMISAFQYEKFKNHPNAAGHYNPEGTSVQSDFAKFPGPVFISKNSLPKIDVIRGRIFTSAKHPSFGISKIENDNFEPLIKAALDTEGFSADITVKQIKIGYNKPEIIRKISETALKYKKGEIKNIIIIGYADRFNAPDKYIKEFINIEDDESFIISFSYDIKRKNFLYVNSYLDFGILYEILEKLIQECPDIKEHISVILADCNTSAVSHIFNLLYLEIKNIFLGPCCPNIVNPVLTDGLSEIFDIKTLSSPEEDFETIKNS